MSTFAIRDVIRLTVVTRNAKGDGTMSTVTLVHRDAEAAFVEARRVKPNFIAVHYGFPSGFAPIPGSDGAVLSFAPGLATNQQAEKLNAPAAALGMLLVTHFDDDAAHHVFCMRDDVHTVADALTKHDPTIASIIISGTCVVRNNAVVVFVETGMWLHPVMAEWTVKIAANYKRRRRILFAVGIDPSEEKVARHMNGCNKFTPEAAVELRKRPGWKATFENFVCTCGHSGPTDEFAQPTCPTP